MIFLQKRVLDRQPYIRNCIALSGNNYDVAISADQSHAFVSGPNSDLVHSVDITDIDNLVLDDTLTDATNLNNVTQLAVTGDYILACADASFASIDASDPTNLTFSDSIATSYNNVTVDGSYAYAVAGAMQVIDVTDPTAMSVVGTVSLGSGDSGVGLAKTGNTLCVTAARSGSTDAFRLINVATPSAPTLGGVVANTTLNLIGGVEISHHGEPIVIGNSRIMIMEIVGTPSIVNTELHVPLVNAGHEVAVWADGGLLVATSRASASIYTFDISTAGSSPYLHTLGMGASFGSGVKIVGDIAFVSVTGLGLCAVQLL